MYSLETTTMEDDDVWFELPWLVRLHVYWHEWILILDVNWFWTLWYFAFMEIDFGLWLYYDIHLNFVNVDNHMIMSLRQDFCKSYEERL